MAHHKSESPLIVGTAGHIDHGKSTLIEALTGTDPDRLAEEKRRGITIEARSTWGAPVTPFQSERLSAW